jgi:hypothetical protein
LLPNEMRNRRQRDRNGVRRPRDVPDQSRPPPRGVLVDFPTGFV